jgi:hypothetical protein
VRRPSGVTPRRHGVDLASVALEGPQFATALELPHLQRAVPRGRDGTSAVLRHRHGVDPAGVAFAGLGPPSGSAVACCPLRRWIGRVPNSRPHDSKIFGFRAGS